MESQLFSGCFNIQSLLSFTWSCLTVMGLGLGTLVLILLGVH